MSDLEPGSPSGALLSGSEPEGFAQPDQCRWRRPALVTLAAGCVLATAGTLATRRSAPQVVAPEAQPRLLQQPGGGTVRLFQTAFAQGTWAWQLDSHLGPDFQFSGPVVDVDVNSRDQVLKGFGGAFTESSASVFQQLTGALQEEVLQRYFSSDGLGYTVGRVHINSCDFSLDSYSFDDTEGDVGLMHFDTTLARDSKALIPLIQGAMKKIQEAGSTLNLLATPWSPPAWMKTNGKMDQSGSPCLRGEYQDAWARYISKWITSYKDHGIPIWAITVQNEPENNAKWEACLFTPQQEADFLGLLLGPTLKREHPEVSIFVFDHNKDHVLEWAQVMQNHPTASRYVTGVAFHWYSGDGFDNVAAVHKQFPGVTLLASEATYEKYRWTDGWVFGMGYAHDIIGDLNAGAVSWMDWNLILTNTGGPNHVQNLCDAAIVADLQHQAISLHPQYYFMGHFSKFLPRGSVRLGTKVSNSKTYTGPTRPYGTCTGDDGIQATAFLRPDSQIAVVVLNCGDHALQYKLRVGQSATTLNMPPKAIQTLLFPSGEKVAA